MGCLRACYFSIYLGFFVFCREEFKASVPGGEVEGKDLLVVKAQNQERRLPGSIPSSEGEYCLVLQQGTGNQGSFPSSATDLL